MRVLIVEDDPSLVELVGEVFESEGYQVDRAENGDDGLFYAEQAIYDFIVLDIMLPGMNGLELTRELRKRSMHTPILLLTAKDSVQDRVLGLDAGADDYLTKPFAIAELLARTRAVLRRIGTVGADGDLTSGRIKLVPSLRDAFVEDQPMKLTTKEFELLEFFLCNKRQIVTRDQIFDRIWGFNSESASSAVDVYVHHLRKKLAAHDCDAYLQTIRGVGYLFKGESHV